MNRSTKPSSGYTQRPSERENNITKSPSFVHFWLNQAQWKDWSFHPGTTVNWNTHINCWLNDQSCSASDSQRRSRTRHLLHKNTTSVCVCVCVDTCVISRFVINARVHSTVRAVVLIHTWVVFYSNANTVGEKNKKHTMRVIHRT